MQPLHSVGQTLPLVTQMQIQSNFAEMPGIAAMQVQCNGGRMGPALSLM